MPRKKLYTNKTNNRQLKQAREAARLRKQRSDALYKDEDPETPLQEDTLPEDPEAPLQDNNLPEASLLSVEPEKKQSKKMPATGGAKRVKGCSIARPFVFGSTATPFDPAKKPANVPIEHTHQWTVFVKGIDDADISYWLKKVQFKLHETYDNSTRVIEGPPFEVTETGWGEFDIQIKLFFLPECHEKPVTTWHQLKLHPYGEDAEKQKEERATIVSKNFDEVVFNEPYDNWFAWLTGRAEKEMKGKGKGAANAALVKSIARGGEIPLHSTETNEYSREVEEKELENINAAIAKVQELLAEEAIGLKDVEELINKLRDGGVDAGPSTQA
ncbi:MAG: NuA4 histone H4 acetyltransferase complex and the SWR1 complex subunit [Vezdaea aestivalis]|nr:MAG: NuA4 histone H4 acetyltransferase complex and the SWR1 complex subunit [Vezdaea aestivalis]